MTFNRWLFASTLAVLALADAAQAQTPKPVKPPRDAPNANLAPSDDRAGSILYLTPEVGKDCASKTTHAGIIPADYARTIAPVVFYPCPTAKPPLVAEPYRPGVTPGELIPLAPEAPAPH